MFDGISSAALQAAQGEGAHDDCIAFLREFPDGSAASHVQSCYDHDGMDSASYTGGSFFQRLWEGGAESAFAAADESNTDRLEEVFGENTFRNVSNPYRAPSPR